MRIHIFESLVRGRNRPPETPRFKGSVSTPLKTPKKKGRASMRIKVSYDFEVPTSSS